jgi:hypothetical protein
MPAREADMAERYGRMRPATGIFRCDLAVLGDGRLAVRYADGSLLAADARRLTELLRESDWRGRDIVIVSAVTTERAAGARRHLASLAAELGCAVTLADAVNGATGGHPVEAMDPEHDLGPVDEPTATTAAVAVAPATQIPTRQPMRPPTLGAISG